MISLSLCNSTLKDKGLTTQACGGSHFYANFMAKHERTHFRLDLTLRTVITTC